MWAAGLGAVRRYTGTLFALFLSNLVVTAVCWLAVGWVLASALARLPMFDAAVDGDLVALIGILRSYRQIFVAVGAMVLGVVILWCVISCFLYGGTIAVMLERPDGRAATARSFGAGAASNFLRCVRLLAISLLAQIATLALFATCLNAAAPALDRALVLRDLVLPLLLALGPPALLTIFLWTVADFARIDLVMHGDSHGLGAMGAYTRALGYVTRNPRTLVHTASSWLGFALVTVAVWWLAHGRPMYGAGGAVLLFAVRQGVALLRTSIKVATIAGQVELARERAEAAPGRVAGVRDPAAG